MVAYVDTPRGFTYIVSAPTAQELSDKIEQILQREAALYGGR